MRKTTLLLAVLLAASFTTTADAAKKRRAAAPKPAPAMSSNQASLSLATGALSNILVPIAHTSAAAPAPAKTVRHKRAHRKPMKKSKNA